MYDFVKRREEDLREAYLGAAIAKGTSEAVIEKDFWVCLTLDYLFNRSQWKDCIGFKGGTCLSKAYNLIKRFSEDIDLILDWRLLGYTKEEPWEERSNNKQQAFIEDSKERLFYYLEKEFLPVFARDMSEIIGKDAIVFIEENNPGIVSFAYPALNKSQVLLPVIRLEIGAMAAWTPAKNTVISSYVSQALPHLFTCKEFTVRSTTPERTFWEKATILHQEAHRAEGSNMPIRYSRHYYDMYCMSHSPVKDSAINQPELLKAVADFKEKFYPRKWAHYELARIGTLKLSPPEHTLARLEHDYGQMRGMIFGEYPSFEELLDRIRELEREINCP